MCVGQDKAIAHANMRFANELWREGRLVFGIW